MSKGRWLKGNEKWRELEAEQLAWEQERGMRTFRLCATDECFKDAAPEENYCPEHL